MPRFHSRTGRIALARRPGVISNGVFRSFLRTNADTAGQASTPKIQTQILENIVKFQGLFPLDRGKWTIRVERDECLEVHKLLILMALLRESNPSFSD